jgi:hypothetical protein
MRGLLLVFLLSISFGGDALASKPPVKAKFYNFSEQVINGEIKKPTALYTDARQRAKFGRLLRLKKSFMNKLFESARESIFR